MDILSTGRHIAITLVGHGDSVLAPTGSLFIAGLLQSVQDPLVQLLQHFLGVEMCIRDRLEGEWGGGAFPSADR